LRLLLHPRPGLAGRLSPEVAGVLVPLLEDELAVGDAVAGLRRYSLARFTGEAGAVAGARDQYAALLPIRERMSGPEHPATHDAQQPRPLD
jgi:hypothetical protein